MCAAREHSGTARRSPPARQRRGGAPPPWPVGDCRCGASFPGVSRDGTMMDPPLSEPIEPRVPDPVAPTTDSELRAHVEKVLSAHYELDCEIGRGGMGIVYRARDRRLKRVVAIKVLTPELAFRSEIRSRFLREAETAAGLNHPNIVPIYAVDEREGLVYFVMACVDGD